MAVPLPNVGTEFVSLKAFKLSVHKSALAHGLEMKTDSAHQRHADMICRLESGPPSKAGGLILNPTTSGKGFAVSFACFEHSCSSSSREARQASGETRRWCENKIAELEAGVVRRRRPVKRREETSTSNGTTSSEEEVSSEDDETPPSRPRQTASSLYPSPHELKNEIEALVTSGNFAKPSKSDTFSSARSLLVTLHASSRQCGFSFFRRSLLTDRTHLYLQCTRNQAKYASSDVGRCGAYLEANERNGQWHVTSVNHKHNHGVSALRQPKPGKRTKLVVEVDSFDEEETESNAAFSFPQPSSSRFFDERSTTTTAFRSKPPPATGSASNPLFQRSTSSLFCHSAQQPPGPPFEVELVAFLCHTLTSPPAATTEEPLETLAAFLLSLGLSSVSDLAAFFLLPNALLDATIESSKAVKIGEVSAEVLFELGRLVGRARREMAAA